MKVSILSIYFAVSSVAYGAENLLEFKNNVHGYSVKYPAAWKIETSADDKDNPSEARSEVIFKSADCQLRDADCSVAIDTPYKGFGEFGQASKKIKSRRFNNENKTLKTFNLNIRGSDYPAVISIFDSLKANESVSYRIEVFFDCGKDQIYSMSSVRKFNGDLKYFQGDEKSFKEKALSPVMNQFLDTFQCPSKDFLNSEKHKKFLKKSKI